MAFTNQVTVNAAGDTNIVPQGPAHEVCVFEDRGVTGWPTSDYLVKKGGSSTYIRIPAGASYIFRSGPDGFQSGVPCGQLKMVSGTTTFDVDESQVVH